MLLLLAFAGQTFGKAMIVVDYQVNNATYLKNCINKYRPMLECNGKCVLAKRMLAQQQKEEKEQQKKMETKADNSISSRSYFPESVIKIVKKHTYFLLFCIGKTISQTSFLLRPPIA